MALIVLDGSTTSRQRIPSSTPLTEMVFSVAPRAYTQRAHMPTDIFGYRLSLYGRIYRGHSAEAGDAYTDKTNWTYELFDVQNQADPQNTDLSTATCLFRQKVEVETTWTFADPARPTLEYQETVTTDIIAGRSVTKTEAMRHLAGADTEEEREVVSIFNQEKYGVVVVGYLIGTGIFGPELAVLQYLRTSGAYWMPLKPRFYIGRIRFPPTPDTYGQSAFSELSVGIVEKRDHRVDPSRAPLAYYDEPGKAARQVPPRCTSSRNFTGRQVWFYNSLFTEGQRFVKSRGTDATTSTHHVPEGVFCTHISGWCEPSGAREYATAEYEFDSDGNVDFRGVKTYRNENPASNEWTETGTVFNSYDYRAFDAIQLQNGAKVAAASFANVERSEIHFKRQNPDGTWPSDEDAILVVKVSVAVTGSAATLASITLYETPDGALEIFFATQAEGLGTRVCRSTRGGDAGSWQVLNP